MIFKALSSKTRIEMLKLLMKSEYHVTGLAKALGISVPVAAKHVKILEHAKLVERKTFGKTHVLSANMAKLYEVMETFGEECEIEVRKGASILEVLKEVAGVRIKKAGDKEFVVSIDDDEGFYIYEVDGNLPNVPINDYKIEKDGEIEIKRLVPVLKKRMRMKVKGGT
ncbi:MAG: ArsR family transcriptional regulator [Methanophagales archaeon ANME-1-THS]|nr:MAG: ArsR family transcriptional regulator [Methanophagales archaeon ANME-1-THS]